MWLKLLFISTGMLIFTQSIYLRLFGMLDFDFYELYSVKNNNIINTAIIITKTTNNNPASVKGIY